MPNDERVPRLIYLGFALVTLTTIVYELLLTRVFSVTIWYHFAFFVISIALFGMAIGAVILYVARERFATMDTLDVLIRTNIVFAIAIIGSFIFHLVVPFNAGMPLFSALFVALTYIVMSVPFIASGISVALILTTYKKESERLYAADLIGAALGCLAVIALLSYLDAPSGVFMVAALPLFASLAFMRAQANASHKQEQKSRAGVYVLIAALLLISCSLLHGALVREGNGFFRPLWVKGVNETKPLYEKWNPISRIRITREPEFARAPFGWGLSTFTPTSTVPEQLYLTIDANAATILTQYSGSTSTLEYLKYDIVNAVHVMRRNASVYVIGVGGGRDILSALVFGQRHVTGIEVNGAIIDTLTQRFGDFTGHIDRDSRVEIHHDEARSYLSRSSKVYDIIQISLIDTWAATAAGAFTLTENTLYTKDAWKVFLDHLSPGGMLSVSRWYSPKHPAETYRLLALAAASLEAQGITNPRDHLILLEAHHNNSDPDAVPDIATLLVSRSPFSAADIVRAQDYADLMGFSVLLTPVSTSSPTFTLLAEGQDPRSIAGLGAYQLEAPTDDDPFFFQTLPFRTVLRNSFAGKDVEINVQAVSLLTALFLIVSILTLLLIVLPLRMTEGHFPGRREIPLLLYFMAIGCGFILIEMAEMQRFIVFLGQPTYALTVVLFTLLVSAGIGSWTVSHISEKKLRRSFIYRFAMLFISLVALSVLHQHIAGATHFALALRITLAMVTLAVPGFFMGMFFPLGMRLARKRAQDKFPWLWGVNGAMSVFASVLAPILAITSGFHVTYMVGALCYVLTFVIFLGISKTDV